MSIIKSIRSLIRRLVLDNVPTMVVIDDYDIVRVFSVYCCVTAEMMNGWKKDIDLAVEHLKIQVPIGFKAKGERIEVLLYEKEREALRMLMGLWVVYMNQNAENDTFYKDVTKKVIKDCKRIIEVI